MSFPPNPPYNSWEWYDYKRVDVFQPQQKIYLKDISSYKSKSNKTESNLHEISAIRLPGN
jgi:hypothetical protein